MFVKINSFLNSKMTHEKVFNIIFISFALNAIFLQILSIFSGTSNSFFYNSDKFADIIKFTLSFNFFPINIDSYPDYIKEYYFNNPSKGIEGVGVTKTNFGMPLSVITSYLSYFLFYTVGIYKTLILYLFLAITFFYLITKLIIKNNTNLFYLAMIFLLSYPFLYLLQRGNFFSLLSFLFLLSSVILNFKGKSFLSMLFLVMAINFRPNLLIFLPLIFLRCENIYIKFFYFCLTLFVTTAFFIIVTKFLYPDYSLKNFLWYLEYYKTNYIIGDLGYPFSLSLLSLYKFIALKFNLPLNVLLFLKVNTILLFFLFIFSNLRYFVFNRISYLELAFCLCVLSLIFTPVFADYHMLIFILPLIIFYFDGCKMNSQFNTNTNLIMLSSTISLSYFSYYYEHGFYPSNFIKTILDLLLFFIILNKSFYKKRKNARF